MEDADVLMIQASRKSDAADESWLSDVSRGARLVWLVEDDVNADPTVVRLDAAIAQLTASLNSLKQGHPTRAVLAGVKASETQLEEALDSFIRSRRDAPGRYRAEGG